jgi:hypothetical protein
MGYNGSDLTIAELLSALHTNLSETKGKELGPCLQRYFSLWEQRTLLLNVANKIM